MLKGRPYLAALRSIPFSLRPARARPSRLTFEPPLRANKPTRRSISSSTLLTRSPTLRSLPWRTSHFRRVRNNLTRPASSAAQEAGSEAAQGLSGRFKQLSRKYGWAAVGVYFGLSVLDFPFCFLAVRLIGPDRIGEAEHAVVHAFWSVVAMVAPSMAPSPKDEVGDLEAEAAAAEATTLDAHGHKVKEEASIWTQLLLAYGVHKSLIFFRVPLTAAVTPKVVKTLRGWGWNIGPRVKKVK